MNQPPYIVFEQLEEHRLIWTYAELQNFMFHWNEGFSLHYITSLLDREWWEGALLVMSIGEEKSRVMLSRPKGIKVQDPLHLHSRYSYELTQFYKEVKENGGIYTVFEYQHMKPKVELIWKPADVKEVKDHWKSGVSLIDIGTRLTRKPLEVALLVIDLISRGYLEIRENGWEGNGHAIEEGGRRKNEHQSDRTERRSA